MTPRMLVDEARQRLDADATLHPADADPPLARAEAEVGVVPNEAADAIASTCALFRPDLAGLRGAVLRDGVVVPELVRQLRDAVGPPHDRYVHLGATSQDVIDAGLLLRLGPVLGILERRLDGLVDRLQRLEVAWRERKLFGRTRMRRARPIAASSPRASATTASSRRAARSASPSSNSAVARKRSAAIVSQWSAPSRSRRPRCARSAHSSASS
jgi:adenylosuccinate lyase